MNVNHYIGVDVHKNSSSYCVKTGDGSAVEEGRLRATHLALREWSARRWRRLHGKEYFSELLDTIEEVPESVKDLLRLSRGALEMFQTTQRQLLDQLQKQPLLAQRVTLLKSIRGVGEVTALTWALEVGDPQR